MQISSYENAPATGLLASHCCFCNRPLVDAESVEAGAGPDCRKKYGYGEAQDPADMVRALSLLQQAGHIKASDKVGAGFDAREVANLLVHTIAGDTMAANVPTLVEAIAALGFTRMAERLRERLVEKRATVRIDVDDRAGLYIVKTPYRPELVPVWRDLPGRRWDPERKANTVPGSSRKQLWAFLLAYFAGDVAHGPAGFFVIEEARA